MALEMPQALLVGLQLGLLKPRRNREYLEKLSSVRESRVQQELPQCHQSWLWWHSCFQDVSPGKNENLLGHQQPFETVPSTVEDFGPFRL